MANLRDLLFGSGALKAAAAGPTTPTVTPVPPGSTGIDVAAEAQKAAARAQAPAATPALTPAPAAPAKKKKPMSTAGAIGAALKEQ